MRKTKRRIALVFVTVIAMVFTLIPATANADSFVNNGDIITWTRDAWSKYCPIKEIEYTYRGDGTFDMKVYVDMSRYSTTERNAAQYYSLSAYNLDKTRCIALQGGPLPDGDLLSFELIGNVKVKAGERLEIKFELEEDLDVPVEINGPLGNKAESLEVTAPSAPNLFDKMTGYSMVKYESGGKEYRDIYVGLRAKADPKAGTYLWAYNRTEDLISGPFTSRDMRVRIYSDHPGRKRDWTGKTQEWSIFTAKNSDNAKEICEKVESTGAGKVKLPSDGTIEAYMAKNYRVTYSSPRYDQLGITVDANSAYNPAEGADLYHYVTGRGEGTLWKSFSFKDSDRSGSFTLDGLLPGEERSFTVHLFRTSGGLRYDYTDNTYRKVASGAFKAASISAVKLSPKKVKIRVAVPGTQAAAGLSKMYVYKGSKKIKTLYSSGKPDFSFVYKGKSASKSRYKVVSVCSKKTDITKSSSSKKPVSNTYQRPGWISGNLNNITPYATARFVPWKVSYYDGKVKVTGYIANNRIFKLKKFSFRVNVYNPGKKVASKKVTYKNIKHSSIKKVTITIKTKKTPDFVNLGTGFSVTGQKASWGI
ncbi:hypothetical protein BHK98_01805 [Hornefia porci]|uniref:Uncharacterized protein n=1 Tax=Hornefia porci TaxID=2652292 RepID=A0A1Q9JFF3_9FIRM|nr:hypothetical protein [Hornefia porci]OLR54925.1 hypothetical protein BHK98_01805 [Hornefia porci]